MKCPIDSAQLVMSERSGVEIDYCPSCRGVWLDRGELDKILDRAATEQAAYGAATPPPSRPDQPYPPQYQQPGYPPQGGYDRGYGGDGGYRKKKKESWLSELFD